MYATVELQLVNLFSLRAAPTNAFTARTLPCPTPAALKLALLAKLIERDAPGRTRRRRSPRLANSIWTGWRPCASDGTRRRGWPSARRR